MDGKRNISDRDELFKIALEMKRISDSRLRRARHDLVRAELDMFRIKQEIEDAETRLAAAEAEHVEHIEAEEAAREEAARAEDEQGDEEDEAEGEGEGEGKEVEGGEGGKNNGEGDGEGALDLSNK